MQPTELLHVVRGQQEAAERARQLYRDRFAPDFNPFDFIMPNEMKLSQILAWLLDPCGTHGQGGRFLKAYLRGLDLAWSDAEIEAATVRVEALTDVMSDWNRRIDILVTSGDHALAIENKPWAADQPAQVSHYLAFLDRTVRGTRCLVYLTRDGGKPSDGSLSPLELDRRTASGELKLQAFSELTPWLGECRGACRSDRVTSFLSDFIRYIDRTFTSTVDMTERNQLVTQITGSLELLQPALEVIAAGQAIREQLLRTLYDQLLERIAVAHRSWRVSENLAAGQWLGISVHFGPSAPAQFRIEFPNRQLNGLFYGLKAEPKCAARLDLAKLRLQLPDAGRQYEVWPWCRNPTVADRLWPVEADWGWSREPWLAIASGRLAETLLPVIEVFAAVVAAADEGATPAALAKAASGGPAEGA